MLLENIDNLIELIDAVTENIAKGAVGETSVLLQELPSALDRVFPDIVESYAKKELKEVQSDMDYWVGQLGRIIAAMQGKDLFAFADILRYETKENLILYKEMIKKAGLA